MTRLALGLAALACLGGTAEAGGDRVAGRKVMGMCQVCHGKDGIAKLPDAPNLAGQKEDYLVNALLSYQRGERQNEQMAVVASGLDETQIADVAAYYSSILITVKVPE